MDFLLRGALVARLSRVLVYLFVRPSVFTAACRSIHLVEIYYSCLFGLFIHSSRRHRYRLSSHYTYALLLHVLIGLLHIWISLSHSLQYTRSIIYDVQGGLKYWD